MIKATFKHSSFDSVTAYGLIQWDYGQTLAIYGLDLPDEVEIHFALDKNSTAIVRTGTTANGVTVSSIPDSLLQHSDDIHVYIYIRNDESGKTVKKITLPVAPRQKPDDYIFSEEERESWTDLRERITVLDSEVAKLQEEIQSVSHPETVTQDFSEYGLQASSSVCHSSRIVTFHIDGTYIGHLEPWQSVYIGTAMFPPVQETVAVSDDGLSAVIYTNGEIFIWNTCSILMDLSGFNVSITVEYEMEAAS